MTLRKINPPKKCPFCFSNPYRYKTVEGLLWHIQSKHLANSSGFLVYGFWPNTPYLRKERKNGDSLLSITDEKELTEWLEDYIKGYKNPSKAHSRIWRFIDE